MIDEKIVRLDNPTVTELIAALGELNQEARVRVHTYAGVRVHGYRTDLGKYASLVDIVGYHPEVEQAARRGCFDL